MGATWSHTAVGDKPADVLAPQAGRPRFGLVFLGDPVGPPPAARAPFGDLLAAAGVGCVCPDGSDCWWADRVCPEFDASRTPERHVLDVVTPWAEAEWGLSPGRIALAGYGTGGQGALRLAFKHPQRFRVVGAVGAQLDCHEAYGRGTPLDAMYPSREHCRQDTAILHVHPSRQPAHIWFAADPDSPWFRGNDRLHEKLAALGVSHTFVDTLRAGGDPATFWDRTAKPLADFLVAALEQESRRLL